MAVAQIIPHPSVPRVCNVPSGTRVFIHCPHCPHGVSRPTEGSAVRALAKHLVERHLPLVRMVTQDNGAA